MNRRILFLILLLAMGCNRGSDLSVPIEDLHAITVKARSEAKQARVDRKLDKAARAADRADVAVTQITAALEAEKEPSEKHTGLQSEARTMARDARYFAEVASEEHQRAKALSSWKAKAYRGSRGVGLATAFKGLALAADKAATHDFDSLPKVARDSANLAAELSSEITGRERLDDDSVDWKVICQDLTACIDDVPNRISVLLAIAFELVGQSDFALYEIEMVDVKKLQTSEDKFRFYLVRGMIFSLRNWQHLAVLEADKIPRDAQDDESGQQIIAGVHLLLAYMYMRGQDYERADQEVVRSMQIWPNNPASVYLTGERLAATGETEKAAESLQQAAQNSEHEWIAERVAQRARQLRDEPGTGQTLLHDRRFIMEVTLEFIKVSAEKSKAAAKLKKSIERGRAFSQKLLKFLPSFGKKKSQ